MLIATVAFATRLPWFICSIPAGVITDRYDRKHLMVGADILRMILTAGLVVCALMIPQPAPAGQVGASHQRPAENSVSLLHLPAQSNDVLLSQ